MDAVPRGRGDSLPLLFFAITLNMTSGAHARRHLRMHRDLLRSIRDPEVQLSRACEDRLLMTGMAAQGIVFGAGEALERALHDVAAGAEGVVVLHVVPADGTESRRAEDEDGRRGGQADLDLALPRFDPGDDREPPPPEKNE